jgi:hypothetical protein
MKAFFSVVVLLSFAAVGAEPSRIFQSTAGGHTFYHIEFTLTANNSTLTVPTNFQDSQWRPESVSEIDDGGMFEVFIRSCDFQVPSPGCNGGWIILRMPRTWGDYEGAKAKMAEKQALFENLKRIYSSKSGSQKVVIELNPYIRVLDPAGPKLELEYCNVFFRHAYGYYVSYVGPIKSPGDPVPLKKE